MSDEPVKNFLASDSKLSFDGLIFYKRLTFYSFSLAESCRNFFNEINHPKRGVYEF